MFNAKSWHVKCGWKENLSLFPRVVSVFLFPSQQLYPNNETVFFMFQMYHMA